jgi:hypothetical protein
VISSCFFPQKTFEVARLVLIDDTSAVYLAQQLLENGELNRETIHEWPLFGNTRTND